MDRCDVIVIGAGINGLVAAVSLAREGRSVTVLRSIGHRQADYSAGWRGTDGFLFPTPVSRLENFPLHLVHDLGLEDYGIRPAPRLSQAVASEKHGILVRDVNDLDMERRLRSISPQEADAWTDYVSAISRQYRYLCKFLDLEAGMLPGRRDLLHLLAEAGQEGLWEAIEIWASSMRQVLDSHFGSDALKALLTASALSGWFGGMGLGPFASTTGAGLLMDPLSLRDGEVGPLFGPVEGGGKVLLGALERAAIDHGVTFVDDTDVSEIAHEKAEIKGVALEGGQFIETSTVIGDVDLKVLFLSLFPWKALPTDLVLDVASVRNKAQIAQVNLVLNGLPEIAGLPEGFLADGSTLFLLNDMEEAEQACDAWRIRSIPLRPPVEFRIEGRGDKGQEDAEAKCYATATLHYIPGELAIGEWTDEHKVRLISGVISRLASLSHGFEKRLVDAKLVLPVDYEDRFGTVGGHLFGGATALDQTLFNRPTPGLALGELPIRGLYLAGLSTPLAPHLSGEGGVHVASCVLDEVQPGNSFGERTAIWTRSLIKRAGLAS